MKKPGFSAAAVLAAALFVGATFAANAQEFKLTSQSLSKEFAADQYWNTFGCTGKNTSPDLKWSGAPAGTKSFAITFYDKDAPTGSGFWHWVAYNVPATVTQIEAGALSAGKLPAGAVEGNTDLGKPGYFGPCPPVGRKHNYEFTVHALKTDKLEIPAGATAAFVGFNLWQNTLSKATLQASAGPRK
ncbi:MAG: hypothetical protein RL341_26 [Pseudomonadota bacterium]|jgi:Raf kinase inhibitor-like YbhB/YbcL family protein